MKKHILKITLSLLIISIILPTRVLAADLTFGQIQDDLTKAKKELNENDKLISDKTNQIIANNTSIKNLKAEVEKMGEEAVKLQQEIADANTEISQKKEQTKNLIVYLQMSEGSNVYLDYVFGGDSITDLVYRLSVVEQITEYNEKMVTELEDLISNNEKRKVELANKQEEYEKKMTTLNNEITKLSNSIAKLGDLSPSLEQQVKEKEKLVNYYKSQGCKNRTDVIGRDCAVTSTNATFSRPIKTGYVTSFIGYRWGSFHRGTDIGSSLGRNTPLYSIGNGTITSIWQDSSGAKCINVQYKTIDGKYYTAIYGHLSRYASNIKEGMQVNSNTILGYMGDSGYAFGVHLHLEVWPCRLYGDSNCSTWNKYVKFAENQFRNGFKGAESVISFPSRTYQTWYNK